MAVSSNYPVRGDPLIRGDDLDIPVDIVVRGVPQDISAWTWLAQVRRDPDSRNVVVAFAITVTTPDDTTVPCRLMLSLTGAQTRQLENGMVMDLQQQTPHLRTWWQVRLRVATDISRVGP